MNNYNDKINKKIDIMVEVRNIIWVRAGEGLGVRVDTTDRSEVWKTVVYIY